MKVINLTGTTDEVMGALFEALEEAKRTGSVMMTYNGPGVSIPEQDVEDDTIVEMQNGSFVCFKLKRNDRGQVVGHSYGYFSTRLGAVEFLKGINQGET